MKMMLIVILAVLLAGISYIALELGLEDRLAATDDGPASLTQTVLRTEEPVQSSDAEPQPSETDRSAESAPAADGAEPTTPEVADAGTRPDAEETEVAALPGTPDDGDAQGLLQSPQSAPAAEPGQPATTDPVSVPEETATDEASPPAPSFDVVTVDPDGTAVIAGRAEPGAEVRVQVGDKTVGTAVASERGEFVVIPDQPLDKGTSIMALEAALPGVVKPMRSNQVVTIVLPDESASPARPDIASAPADTVRPKAGVDGQPAVAPEEPSERLQVADLPPATSDAAVTDRTAAPQAQSTATAAEPPRAATSAPQASAPDAAAVTTEPSETQAATPRPPAADAVGTSEQAPDTEIAAASPITSDRPAQSGTAAGAPAADAAETTEQAPETEIAAASPTASDSPARSGTAAGAPAADVAASPAASPSVIAPASDSAAEAGQPATKPRSAAATKTDAPQVAETGGQDEVGRVTLHTEPTPPGQAAEEGGTTRIVVAPSASDTGTDEASVPETSSADASATDAPAALPETGQTPQTAAVAPSAEQPGQQAAPVSPAEPTRPVEVATPADSTPETGRTTQTALAATDSAQQEPPAAPVSTAEPPASADAERPTTPAAQPEQQTAAAAPVTKQSAPADAVETPSSPVVVLSERGEPSRVLQTPDPAPADDRPITFESVDYDDEGQIILAGRVETGTNVRAYINNELLGDAAADSQGQWALKATRDIEPGAYELRVDQIDPSGAVIARVAAPFERVAPDIVAEARGRGEIIIQPGDNLWNLARDVYGSGTQYTTIYNANMNQIIDPDLIYPGQVLLTPGAVPAPRDSETADNTSG